MSLSIALDGRTLQPQRIFCIGRNYGAHIKELGNGAPAEPVVFMKPAVCLVPPGETVHVPPYGGDFQHEVELVLLIGREGANIAEAAALDHIAGVTLGLDLTLRDVQNRLKSGGLPWELCKSFDGSAPIGRFIPYTRALDLAAIEFFCAVNGAVRQKGNSGDMIFPVPALIRYLSGWWRLQPGDLIFTGTPAGVGPLRAGDTIVIGSAPTGEFAWTVSREGPA